MREEDSSVLSCEGDVISTVPDMVAGGGCVCCGCRESSTSTLVQKKLWWGLAGSGCWRAVTDQQRSRCLDVTNARQAPIARKPKLPEHHHTAHQLSPFTPPNSPRKRRPVTFTARLFAHRQLLNQHMAGPGNLYFNCAEAKFIHIINLVLVLKRCDATRRAHSWDCWYSRAALVANVPVALLASYGLYRLFRPL